MNSMLRRALVGAMALVLASHAAAAQDAGHMWPPPASITRAQAADPLFWPNDPDYPNQWEHWSWMPQANQMLPRFRSVETSIGAGNNVDRAWGISIGDPRVIIAVIDCGIRWDEDSIQLQTALNVGELPMPMGAASYDANGDGVINVADYLNDPRVPCGTALPHPLRACQANGANNDPNSNGVFDAGDLIRAFSDGVDTDHNGYTDDIAGWDFMHDDNDPADDTSFGHGTGETRWSNAAGNDAIGSIGSCPRCQSIMLRAGDSFIAEVNSFAKAVVYAADADYGAGPDGQHRRVRLVQEALGTLDNSRFAQRAIDYAYNHNVLVVASAADENSRHHNVPGTSNHTMVVHAVRYNGGTRETSTSFLAYNNCTNYGGALQLSVAGTGCSSEATGQSSGIAGLIYAAAMQRTLTPPLTAEEVRQIFIGSVDDINVPESVPGAPNYDPTLYPTLPGWDQRSGYGRTNARTALEMVRDGRIPPEVDITSPRWFTVQFPDRAAGQHLRIEGRIAATRAPTFDYTVEWAAGIEPATNAWQTLRHETNVTAPITNTLADLDLSAVQIDNRGEHEDRFTITVRVRATAHYNAPVGDVPGESRRVFAVTRDPDLLPGFPVDLGASGESSPHVADLNADGRAEIVVSGSDGLVHAIESDGTELAGFPVHTNPERGLDAARMPSYRNAPAYSGATPAIDPAQQYEAVLATAAIADLDGNGTPEIVVASYHGSVYVFNHDGTAWGHGFPRTLPDVPSSATGTDRTLDLGIVGSPVLVDLDGNGTREIVFGAFDGKLYAIDAMTAADHVGFPVLIHYPRSEYNRVFGSVGVGHIDADNIPDIVVVSSERPDLLTTGDRNSGTIYVVHGDGNMHAGGPFHPNWPLLMGSENFFPLIGDGITSPPAIADVDGDGLDDLSISGNGYPTIVIAHGVQPAHDFHADPISYAHLANINSSSRGPLSNSRLAIASMVNAFSYGSFGDMTGDGVPEYVMTGASLDLALNLAGGGHRVPFDHLAGAWDARTGQALPGFPQVIEDYTFFQDSAIADVSGDAYAEMIFGTGGYYVRALDACGREAPGFPKFTGQWVIPSPVVADIDNDSAHVLEVTVNTRAGYLYSWHTQGHASGSVQWPTFRHDNANTGNYGTPVGFGARHVDGTAPIVCPLPPRPDAGLALVDASTDGDRDATPDGGMTQAVGGCGCRIPDATRSSRTAWTWAPLLAGLALVRPRRRRAR